ncbi:hypothetical protein T492DRAFT_887498 [Pavlovales sp. CCMP2436]|nr:hypothetical protein T492DRAFT_887498 [Pavlovales sp. CCMP2436]
MLSKYCKSCYEKLKSAVDRGCGMPVLHGHDKIRRCPVLTDPDLLLPTPVKRNQGMEHTEDNLVFVTRFVGNAMRNGHATLAQAQEARACSQYRPQPSLSMLNVGPKKNVS